MLRGRYRSSILCVVFIATLCGSSDGLGAINKFCHATLTILRWVTEIAPPISWIGTDWPGPPTHTCTSVQHTGIFTRVMSGCKSIRRIGGISVKWHMSVSYRRIPSPFLPFPLGTLSLSPSCSLFDHTTPARILYSPGRRIECAAFIVGRSLTIRYYDGVRVEWWEGARRDWRKMGTRVE